MIWSENKEGTEVEEVPRCLRAHLGELVGIFAGWSDRLWLLRFTRIRLSNCVTRFQGCSDWLRVTLVLGNTVMHYTRDTLNLPETPFVFSG